MIFDTPRDPRDLAAWDALIATLEAEQLRMDPPLYADLHASLTAQRAYWASTPDLPPPTADGPTIRERLLARRG